jgi:carbon monoxide dehydrogenase subunit G
MARWRLIIGVWVILTWTATTSSIVMGQDAHSQHGTHPVGALERVFQSKMSFPDEIRPGESFTINGKGK